MSNTPQSLQSKYSLQIVTYLYENGAKKGKNLSEDTGVPEATAFRRLKELKEEGLVTQEGNQYKAKQKAKDFVEKLMDEAGYEPEEYLEITTEYNHFKKRLNRLRNNYEDVLATE